MLRTDRIAAAAGLDYNSWHRMRNRIQAGLLGIAAYAGYGVLTAWTDPPDADTPPMFPLMLMLLGFLLLAIHLLRRLLSRGVADRRASPRGFDVVQRDRAR